MGNLQCRECGKMIEGTSRVASEAGRRNAVCASCKARTDNLKTIQCSKCRGACTVQKNFIHNGDFVCEKCGDLIREMMRNRALGGAGKVIYSDFNYK